MEYVDGVAFVYDIITYISLKNDKSLFLTHWMLEDNMLQIVSMCLLLVTKRDFCYIKFKVRPKSYDSLDLIVMRSK